MILTVLVGNTNTRITGFHGLRPTSRRVVTTTSFLSAPTRCITGFPEVEAVALATVIPGTLSATRDAARRTYGLPVFHVNRRTRTGLRIQYDRGQLGADRICTAVGASSRFPEKNLVVIDMGTAVTVNVITAEGCFLGGAILPGRSLMLSSLSKTRSGLPKARPVVRRRTIQRSTRAALQSGVQHALAGGLAHVISAVETETNRAFDIIATGGDAGLLRGRIKHLTAIDADLAARGLAELYLTNRTPIR